jgi:RimJ/RimL family protein N-acetyltransferase
MTKSAIQNKNSTPEIEIEHLREELTLGDLQDLCDATDSAIENGGGFGWVDLPARETLERYWQGVIIMPNRQLFVARLDGVICGTCQLIRQPGNNEAQAHIMNLTTHFVSPWARGHGLARMLLQRAAIKLYESEGYDQFATHPAYAYVDGSFVPGRYYMKILEES